MSIATAGNAATMHLSAAPLNDAINGSGEAVQVVVQVRPLLFEEVALGASGILSILGKSLNLTHPDGSDSSFTGFDALYDECSSRTALFENNVRPLVRSLFEGFNATVLAYGSVASGKTVTMDMLTARVVGSLFEHVEEVSISNDVTVSVRMKFVEVYDEKFFDLLRDPGDDDATSAPDIRLKELPQGNGVALEGASETLVKDRISLMQAFRKGSRARHPASNAKDSSSSNSESILLLTVRVTPPLNTSRISAQCNCTEKSTCSTLMLVDLAGSAQTQQESEGSFHPNGETIGNGISAVSEVVTATVRSQENGCQRSKPLAPGIPYEKSILTKLLRESFGGNAHALFIACVSPADSSLEETANTLRWATLAKKISNFPRVNTEKGSDDVGKLRQALKLAEVQIEILTAENKRLAADLLENQKQQAKGTTQASKSLERDSPAGIREQILNSTDNETVSSMDGASSPRAAKRSRIAGAYSDQTSKPQSRTAEFKKKVAEIEQEKREILHKMKAVKAKHEADLHELRRLRGENIIFKTALKSPATKRKPFTVFDEVLLLQRLENSWWEECNDQPPTVKELQDLLFTDVDAEECVKRRTHFVTKSNKNYLVGARRIIDAGDTVLSILKQWAYEGLTKWTLKSLVMAALLQASDIREAVLRWDDLPAAERKFERDINTVFLDAIRTRAYKRKRFYRAIANDPDVQRGTTSNTATGTAGSSNSAMTLEEAFLAASRDARLLARFEKHGPLGFNDTKEEY